LKNQLIVVLRLNLADNVKARVLKVNGQYERVMLEDGAAPYRSQFDAQYVERWKGSRESVK